MCHRRPDHDPQLHEGRILAMVADMGDERRGAFRRGRFREKEPARKSEFPPMPYPKDARVSIKHIAYLHIYCGKEPREIVSRYPKTLTLAQAHLALFHYFTNREAIDAEIASDRQMNTRDALAEPARSLPTLGLGSLIDLVKRPAS